MCKNMSMKIIFLGVRPYIHCTHVIIDVIMYVNLMNIDTYLGFDDSKS